MTAMRYAAAGPNRTASPFMQVLAGALQARTAPIVLKTLTSIGTCLTLQVYLTIIGGWEAAGDQRCLLLSVHATVVELF